MVGRQGLLQPGHVDLPQRRLVDDIVSGKFGLQALVLCLHRLESLTSRRVPSGRWPAKAEFQTSQFVPQLAEPVLTACPRPLRLRNRQADQLASLHAGQDGGKLLRRVFQCQDQPSGVETEHIRPTSIDDVGLVQVDEARHGVPQPAALAKGGAGIQPSTEHQPCNLLGQHAGVGRPAGHLGIDT